jgi:hypothetical protein
MENFSYLARFLHHLLMLKQGAFMNKKDLISKIAKLESINDQLVAELSYIDSLVRQVGFDEGVKTLKMAAMELLEEIESESSDNEDLG